MYNIMNTIERIGLDKFIEEWGNILSFFIKRNIAVFDIEKYRDEKNKAWGIRVGLRFGGKYTLESNPKNFQHILDPKNLDDYDPHLINSDLLRMYYHREKISIVLSSLSDDVYYTSIGGIDLGDDGKECKITYHNAIGTTELGYFREGTFIYFNVNDEDKKYLNDVMALSDNIIYSFLKIYLLSWFISQPSLN